MSRRGLPLLVCCLLLVNMANAGEVLDSLITAAIEHNPDIRAAEFEKAAADYMAAAAGALPDPNLTIAALNLPRTSLALGETPMSGVVLGVSQMVPWPSKLGTRSKIAELNAEMGAAGVVVRENHIIRLVRESYYEYSFWCRADDILDKNIGLIGSIIDVAETRYANGVGMASDILRAQTNLARMENRKLEIERMRQSALALLAILTGSQPAAGSYLEPELPDEIASEVSAKTALTAKGNPELRLARLRAEVAGEKLSLSRKAYWPDLMVGVDYVLRKDHPMDAVHGEDYLSIKIGLQAPLWFFKKQKNEARSARETYAAAGARQEAVNLQIERQLTDIRLMLEAIRGSLQNYRDRIMPQAVAAYDVARSAYENGKNDFDNLFTIQMDLFNIELEELGLLKNYRQAAARYDELIGFGRQDGR